MRASFLCLSTGKLPVLKFWDSRWIAIQRLSQTPSSPTPFFSSSPLHSRQPAGDLRRPPPAARNAPTPASAGLPPAQDILHHGTPPAEEMLQVDYRPSAIAVASILVAADEIVTKDSLRNKLKTISFGRSLDSDHVFAAYNLMYDLKAKTPSKMVLSPHQTKMGDDPTLTNVEKKRRVLPFDD